MPAKKETSFVVLTKLDGGYYGSNLPPIYIYINIGTPVPGVICGYFQRTFIQLLGRLGLEFKI